MFATSIFAATEIPGFLYGLTGIARPSVDDGRLLVRVPAYPRGGRGVSSGVDGGSPGTSHAVGSSNRYVAQQVLEIVARRERWRFGLAFAGQTSRVIAPYIPIIVGRSSCKEFYTASVAHQIYDQVAKAIWLS